MKLFKKIDFFINLLLIACFAAVTRSVETLITGYFIVGSWQVISMIVHAVTRCFTKKRGSRYIYHWITAISIITLPLGSYWILLFSAPLMAIYYCFLCYRETFVKMVERPLSLLK